MYDLFNCFINYLELIVSSLFLHLRTWLLAHSDLTVKEFHTASKYEDEVIVLHFQRIRYWQT